MSLNLLQSLSMDALFGNPSASNAAAAFTTVVGAPANEDGRWHWLSTLCMTQLILIFES